MGDIPIRKFNAEGLAQFAAWLEAHRHKASAPPVAMLTDPALTEMVSGLGPISTDAFATKYEMGKEVLKALGTNWEAHINDAGLMAWLSLALHKSTMVDGKGQVFIGTPSRHILALDTQWKNYTHCRRHLVRSAAFFLGHYGDKGRVFLAELPGENSKLEEQVPARIKKGLAYCRSLAEAIYQLYWDEKRQTHRRGSRGEGAGGIIRLIKILEQLDVTFDIQTVTGDQLVALLPKEEFQDYLKAEAPKAGKAESMTAVA